MEDKGEKPNYAKELKARIAELKNEIKEDKQQIKTLTASARIKGSIKFHRDSGDNINILKSKLKALTEKVEPIEQMIKVLEQKLQPYIEITDKLKGAKKRFKELQKRFIKHLHEAREALSDDDCCDLVLDILNEKLSGHIDSYVTVHRWEVIAAVENWWNKYRVTLRDIGMSRDKDAEKLNDFFKDMNYAK